MSRNNRNSKQWSWCQTTTFYGSSIKVVTLSTQCWCYHITHHSSPCVCVYFLPLQSWVAGCCSLQLQSPAAWPCTTLTSLSSQLARYQDVLTSLRAQIRTYFRNFQQNKIDTEEGAALHPVLDFKTSSSATGGSYWELKDWKLLGYNDEVTLDIGKVEKQ